MRPLELLVRAFDVGLDFVTEMEDLEGLTKAVNKEIRTEEFFAVQEVEMDNRKFHVIFLEVPYD